MANQMPITKTHCKHGHGLTPDNVYIYPSGKLYRCKTCHTADNLRFYYRNSNEISDYRKEYSQTEAGIKYKREHTRHMRQKYPEKDRCRVATRYAIGVGKLVKQPCEVCGENKVQAHHHSYDKPLEVKWLCQKHHIALHSKLNKSEVEDETI